MSYDLYLVQIKPGQDPLTTAQEWFEREADDDLAPLSDQRKREVHRLVNALREAFSELGELFERDEAVTLMDPASGVTLAFYADETAISIAYWHTGERAATVLAQVGRYAALLQREGGYVAYDPQTEELFDGGHARGILDNVGEHLSRLIASREEADDPPSTA